MNELKLNIISPESRVFEGPVLRVTLPGRVGAFTILPHHAPIVSSLQGGTLAYVTTDGSEHTLDIHGGFVEMSDDHVDVCIN